MRHALGVASEPGRFFVKDSQICSLTTHFTCSQLFCICIQYRVVVGARGSVVVKAVCYKPKGRRLDTR
jgi:hypothetical protein